MAKFLLELYMSRNEGGGAGRAAERTGHCAAELTREGTPARFVRSIFVPEDETCLLLVEAGSSEVVHEVARRAGLPVERVTEAVADQAGEETFPCP